MNYKIELIQSFRKDVKKLSKKYKQIKKDLSTLKTTLSTNPPKEIGTSIGKNCFKIRLKNSDNQKGKSGGYRVIYFYIDGDIITLLSIYSKSEIENISENEVIERLKEIC